MTANEPLVSHDSPSLSSTTDAAGLLTQIERYTAQLVAQVRFVIERLFQDEPPHVSAKEFFASYRVHLHNVSRLSVARLDHYAPHWGVLVADVPSVRAALFHEITQHHRFTRAMIPHIIDVLKLNDPATGEAYTVLSRQSLDQAFLADLAPFAESPALPGMESFDPALIADFEQEVHWRGFKRGETVLRQGDPGDGLYVVASGRLEIVTVQPDGTWRTIDNVGRGEIVGEMSLISGDPRSATVIAARDTSVMRLSRDGFDRLTLKYPQFMMRVVRSVITRLGQQAAARRPQACLATMTIAPTSPDVPLDRFAEMLIEALEAFGPVLRLSSEGVDRYLGHGAAQTPADSAASGRVIGWLNEQEAAHRFVIYQADSRWSNWTQRCLRQADRVLFVGLANHAPDRGEIESRLCEILPVTTAPRQELVLMHSPGMAFSGTDRWLSTRCVDRHHHVSTSGDYERLARLFAGRALGVVFSGGGVRGFAHIGVIRALHELGIQPDAVGGTSAGALAAAAYALGYDTEAIYQMAKEHVFDRKAGIDYTLPLVAVMGGRKLTRAVTCICGENQIEDLRIPFFCTTTNLSTSKLAIHRHGLLRRAVRASMSLPGVYPPIPLNGELHVDGGVLNNIPVDVLAAWTEGGPVIGMEVSPKTGRHTQYTYGDSLTAGEIIASRLNPFGQSIKAPSLLKILLRSMLLSSTSARPLQIARADLIIELPLSEFGLLDFRSFERLVAVGYQTARDQLEAWRLRQ